MHGDRLHGDGEGPRHRGGRHGAAFGRGAERIGEWGGAWRGGGRRARRGDIRTALLVALTDGPGHGYELIGRLEEKSEGAWRPSPGSVYPTLQLFEDEGLVRVEERDGKRVYSLTDAGRAEATERVARHGSTPWEPDDDGGGGLHALRRSVGQLMVAAKQVSFSGDAAQVERATSAVRGASKALYQILSEDTSD